jgi:SGNH hydrolase-like domain, acetyltransferase AlgX
LAKQLNIPFIDLCPVFEASARDGKLLYYPFDTHWNSEGREVAAAFVAKTLRGRVEVLHEVKPLPRTLPEKQKSSSAARES